MKKIFLISVLCLLYSTIFAQMSFSSRNFITETVDEFGDKTGDFKVGIIAKGYFSNSATTNSCAELVISMMKNKSWTDLYEYCGDHASSDDFITTFEGTSTNEIVKTSYNIPLSFLELCKRNDTVKVKMRETSDYGTTSAVFKLFNCKTLYKNYIKTFGEIEYTFYKNKGTFLNVYNTKIAVYDKFPSPDLPTIEFWKASRYISKNIKFGGKFTNGDYVSTNGERIVIDGRPITKDDYLCKPDYNAFMENLHAGSIVEVYHKDGKTKETFEITQELYDVITNFFNE